jgi:3-methylcrotonyl-CoA carboxylase alpha subunit
MIAKIIGHGADRAEAYTNLMTALDETVLLGLRTNLDFLYRLSERSARIGESLSTRYIERNLEELTATQPDDIAIQAGAATLLNGVREEALALRQRISSEPRSPWDAVDGFEYTGTRSLSYDVLADGERSTARLGFGDLGAEPEGGDWAGAWCRPAGEGAVIVWRKRRQTRVSWPERKSAGGSGGAQDGALRAPMPGKLTKVMIQAGDKVARGDRMAIVEAMKMEHVLHAPSDGLVVSVPRAEGEQVEQGTVIAELKAL